MNFNMATEEHSRHGAKCDCTGNIPRKQTLGTAISLFTGLEFMEGKREERFFEH